MLSSPVISIMRQQAGKKMEIDPDNLVIEGLEEAEERNAARQQEADKKAEAIVADDDCGDACKI
ncbi:hypothetical protein B5M10_21175 [Pluralibacter gergoviae]|nr:hypothetical protein SS31_04990 [Pluralibacter gergoviae]KMK19430.1 hypothetical protein ABW09_03905 [Pluralibacter gergoviae]OUQ94111.1 hypothetical protein B5M10_21175 [Pluralibacter gergoviae]